MFRVLWYQSVVLRQSTAAEIICWDFMEFLFLVLDKEKIKYRLLPDVVPDPPSCYSANALANKQLHPTKSVGVTGISEVNKTHTAQLPQGQALVGVQKSMHMAEVNVSTHL